MDESNNMTTNKVNTAPRDSQPSPECCMCGDFGLSNELFQCQVCQFRSQHRYCSNLYPKAESYQVCNWCLSQKDDKEKSQNSSNSSSNKTNSEEDSKNKRKNSNNTDNHGNLKGQRSTLQLQLNKPIKKQRSPERSPSTRKRIITNGALEEKLKRTRSEEISNRVITKPIFRNKRVAWAALQTFHSTQSCFDSNSRWTPSLSTRDLPHRDINLLIYLYV